MKGVEVEVESILLTPQSFGVETPTKLEGEGRAGHIVCPSYLSLGTRFSPPPVGN